MPAGLPIGSLFGVGPKGYSQKRVLFTPLGGTPQKGYIAPQKGPPGFENGGGHLPNYEPF